MNIKQEFTKTDYHIRREEKALKNCINKLHETENGIRIENVILKTNNETYFEVFEKLHILNCLVQTNGEFSHNITQTNRDMHFVFDFKLLYEKEIVNENRNKIKINIGTLCENLSIFSKITENAVNENIIAFSIENGIMPLSIGDTEWILLEYNVRPSFFYYKTCRITNPSRFKDFKLSKLYFNDFKYKYKTCRYKAMIKSAYITNYLHKSVRIYKDGEKFEDEVVGPSNTSYDILMKLVQERIKQKYGYSINPLRKLAVFLDKKLIVCYIYDNSTGLYVDEEYLKEKNLKIERLGLPNDICTILSMYYS